MTNEKGARSLAYMRGELEIDEGRHRIGSVHGISYYKICKVKNNE